jgi:hypothetical protein
VTTVYEFFLEGGASLQTASATDAAVLCSDETASGLSGLHSFPVYSTRSNDSYIGGCIIMMACLVGSAEGSSYVCPRGWAVDVGAVSANDSPQWVDSKP